ncbi:hypothetical protein M758_1G248100 [Ceratodon purpureus]|nr:hypothetical protein M758_1G248100 [Ceratodon purpureus]
MGTLEVLVIISFTGRRLPIQSLALLRILLQQKQRRNTMWLPKLQEVTQVSTPNINQHQLLTRNGILKDVHTEDCTAPAHRRGYLLPVGFKTSTTQNFIFLRQHATNAHQLLLDHHGPYLLFMF